MAEAVPQGQPPAPVEPAAPEDTAALEAGERGAEEMAEVVEAAPSERQVRFAASEATRSEREPEAAARRIRGVATSHSVWRWPSEPGKLPHYIRAQFVFKSFGLIATQCLIAFAVAALVELVFRSQVESIHKGGFSFAVFIAMGCATMVALLILLCTQRIYPVNYLVLLLVTLLVGATWGMGGTSLATHAHFQLFGILCVATSFTAASSSLVHRSGLKGKRAVAAPLLLGWAIGSAAEAVLAWRLGASPLWSLLAVLVALGQILWLLLDVGDMLLDCNPDDFMRIVISMDSTLLVVVSIPLFIVAACFLHSNRAMDHANPIDWPENAEGLGAAAA